MRALIQFRGGPVVVDTHRVRSRVARRSSVGGPRVTGQLPVGPPVRLVTCFRWQCACGAININEGDLLSPEEVRAFLVDQGEIEAWEEIPEDTELCRPPLSVQCGACASDWRTEIADDLDDPEAEGAT